MQTISQLLSAFDCENPRQFARAIYKSTDCGAWVSFITPKGIVQSGDLTESQNTIPWPANNIIGIKIGSIVEGSDAEFSCDPLTFPFDMEDLQKQIDWLEAETSAAWDEANEE